METNEPTTIYERATDKMAAFIAEVSSTLPVEVTTTESEDNDTLADKAS